jgi:mannose-6-phosphate isomerase-like protein (cupin superfamily)
MAIEFYPQFFKNRSDVLDDIKSDGTWPSTYVSGPSEGLHVHWHSHEVHAYIMEGETDFLDAESTIRTAVKAGDKVIIPARTLHAEGAVKERVVYILATPDALLPNEFLAVREIKELHQ